MRAFDLNFARAARIFDPNFVRAGRKPARPRGKIPSGERVLRGDEILNGGGILSDRALNVGEIISGGKFWIDNKILKGGEILNEASRGRTRRGFCRWILRELRSETMPRCIKFQSPSYVLARLKFQGAINEMSAGSPSAPLKFQISVATFSRLKFQSTPNAITRLKFQSAVAATTAFSRLKFGSLPRAAQCHEIRARGQGG